MYIMKKRFKKKSTGEVGKETYLYIYKSIRIGGTKKKITKYIGYIGKDGKYTKKELAEILAEYKRKEDKKQDEPGMYSKEL